MICPAARILADYLIAEGVSDAPETILGASADDWIIVVGGLPSQSSLNNVISCTDAGVAYYGRNMRTGERETNPAVHVTIRSLQYADGFDKGHEIEDLMDQVGRLDSHGIPNWPIQTVESVAYEVVGALVTLPFQKIGEEPTNLRQLFSATVRLAVRAA